MQIISFFSVLLRVYQAVKYAEVVAALYAIFIGTAKLSLQTFCQQQLRSSIGRYSYKYGLSCMYQEACTSCDAAAASQHLARWQHLAS